MKKKIQIALIATACLLCGCASKQNTSATDTTTATNTLEQETTAKTQKDTVAAPSDYVSEELMAEADKWQSCDDSALAAVMKKAMNGEKVVIAAIGGSITQGTIARGSSDSKVENKKYYAEIYFDWWRKTFPNTEFEFVNAGIGGTDSYLGVHRVDNDVLSHKPDLVLVEYSVNDGTDAFHKKSYDNLIRKIALSDNKPATMLLFMSQTNKSTSQSNQVLIGFGYHLPMVSYANVIFKMMDDGIYTAGELSGDTVHPSNLGHAIAGEIIWKYLNSVYADLDSFGAVAEFNYSPVTKDKYLNATILDSTNITPDTLGSFIESKGSEQFPHGWKNESGNGEIEFTAEFMNLGILYLDTVSGKSGKFDIYVDGELAGTINADFPGGWGNAITADEVYTSTEKKEHKILIKKSGDSDKEIFDLLGLMIS